MPKLPFLVGLGLDRDGHFRLTQSEHFHLVGGTQATHSRMQEVAIKVTERLARKQDPSPEEVRDVIEEMSDRFGE